MMKKHYDGCNALSQTPQAIVFQSDSITLDIPEEGVSANGGWRVRPLMHPTVSVSVVLIILPASSSQVPSLNSNRITFIHQVLKSDVDSYIPGENSVLPHCQLSAQFSGKRKKVPNLTHTISMIGVRRPFTYLVVDVDPYAKSSDRGMLT